MAARTCHNCIYARFDPCEWLHNAFFDLPLAPKCANHPHFPGVLMEVPGVACPNYRARPPEPESNVRRIPLDDGHYAIVDAADYEWLRQYNWHFLNGYAARRTKGKTIYMHQQIMQPPEGMAVDHHNRNKLDNRRSNLRVCTNSENKRNQGKKSGSFSPFKGVGYSKSRHKWFARLHFEGKAIWLGYCEDEIAAARAYDRAAVAYFREFAHLNFPEEWPPERRQEVYARQDAAAKKEAKKLRRKEGQRNRKPKGRQSTQRSKRKNDAGQTPATRSRKAGRCRPAMAKRAGKKSPQAVKKTTKSVRKKGTRARQKA
jgi:hypothetical protein